MDTRNLDRFTVADLDETHLKTKILYTIYEPDFLAMLYAFMRNRRYQDNNHFGQHIIRIEKYANGAFGTLFFVTFSNSEHAEEDILGEETRIYEVCPVLSDEELAHKFSSEVTQCE